MNAGDDHAELFGILKTLRQLAERRAAHVRRVSTREHFADLWGELESAADDYAAGLPSHTEH